jgi:hypothetical protein
LADDGRRSIRQCGGGLQGEEAAAVWVPDDAADACTQCRSKFTLLRRRHHCRACGAVVCQSCSGNKVLPRPSISSFLLKSLAVFHE